MAYIQIVNWAKFQHYKGRNPPWLKLHRQLLDNRQWFSLSGDASKLLVCCWLLASKYENGAIPLSTADLCWQLRRSDTDVVASLLQELAAAGFIELCEHDASTTLAPRKQDAIAEAETETETEKKETPSGRSNGATARVLEDGFAEFWAAYPVRDGNRRRKDALKSWRARRREGFTAALMTEATVRYARWCFMRKFTGTDKVMQAPTFLNDPEHFTNEWVVPSTNGSAPSDVQAEADRMLAELAARRNA